MTLWFVIILTNGSHTNIDFFTLVSWLTYRTTTVVQLVPLPSPIRALPNWPKKIHEEDATATVVATVAEVANRMPMRHPGDRLPP